MIPKKTYDVILSRAKLVCISGSLPPHSRAAELQALLGLGALRESKVGWIRVVRHWTLSAGGGRFKLQEFDEIRGQVQVDAW